jgi:hypothetical protein
MTPYAQIVVSVPEEADKGEDEMDRVIDRLERELEDFIFNFNTIHGVTATLESL